MENVTEMKKPAVKFMQTAGEVFFVEDRSGELHDKIPNGNFVVCAKPFTGELYLKAADPFVMPSKLYGDTVKESEKILNTFRTRDKSTGVLLVGDKGSGKSLLAKHIAHTGNMPVILVTSPLAGDTFMRFLDSIKQDCVVLFDEFEKVYDSETQQQMLTLFDGVFVSKKLFLLTCNKKELIDENMINRPGRIYYNMSFGGLAESFIKEYCQDKMNEYDEVFADEIVKVSRKFKAFTFDMLAAVVEEKNRYNEDLEDMMVMLNVSPDSYVLPDRYNLKFYLANPDGSLSNIYTYEKSHVFHGNIKDFRYNLSDSVTFNEPPKKRVSRSKKKTDDYDNEDLFTDSLYIRFTVESCIRRDKAIGKYWFAATDGARNFIVEATKLQETDYSAYSF